MPVSEGGGAGRDHNPHGFLSWMLGAGIKGGTSYGETDELGHKAVDLLPQWPPLPADRCRRQRADEHFDMIREENLSGER
jgi:hypothetical protein